MSLLWPQLIESGKRMREGERKRNRKRREKEKVESWHLALVSSFSYFIQSRIPGMGWCWPHSGVNLLIQLIFSGNTISHTKVCKKKKKKNMLFMSCNLIKSTVKINHHTDWVHLVNKMNRLVVIFHVSALFHCRSALTRLSVAFFIVTRQLNQFLII